MQVRYPRAEQWVTVAVSGTRGIAARLAGDMYRDLRNEQGASPVQVRIVSDESLRRAGGEAAVKAVAADLWRGAKRASLRPARPRT